MILFALFPLCAVSGARDESPSKEDQIREIETELSREKEKFQRFDEKEKGLLKMLADLEAAIAEKRAVVAELKKRIREKKGELKERQAGLKELELSLEQVEKRLGKRLVAFYQYAKRGSLQLLSTARGLSELRKRIKYLQVILGEDLNLMKRKATVKEAHTREISVTREKLEAIDRMEKEENERLLSIKSDLDKKVLLLMKIHKEKEFYETAVKELKIAAEKLKETLLSLEKKQKKKIQHAGLPSGFQRTKGGLSLPFEGRIVGDRDPVAAGLQSGPKGIYIEGAPGVEVTAVFPGRIEYSGWLKGYGEMVIINHGSRYYSISAHLAERIREEGEMVEKGDGIGRLGRGDGAGKPRLYFELREGAANLDPMQWLKVR